MARTRHIQHVEPTQTASRFRWGSPDIAGHGRRAWQEASGYNKRARVEATMNRWKQGIGGELRTRTDQRRATEVAVAVHALNRMLEMGCPNCVRVA